MISDRIRNIFKKKNYLLLIIPIIIILGLYFKTFFTKGTFFYNEFLKREVESTETHYLNKKIHIVVDRIDHNNITVTYNLPENLKKEYYIDYTTFDNREFNIKSLKNQFGKSEFEGKYRIGTIWLEDKNGEPIFNSASLSIGRSGYETYQITPLSTLNIAFSANDRIRGQIELLLMAILFFIITFIDIKYPLFLFTLNHFLDVKDPEPSDFYIAMQKVGWVVMPIIGIILMILAINI